MNGTIVRGLTSVILPWIGQRNDARHCLAALARYTRPPWELIVADDGSNDVTLAYLDGVRDAASFPVTVITNSGNRGFSASANQCLELARGEHIVLIDNDVVVTDAWLDQLLALAAADSAIGIVGPTSNHAPPPQLVADVPYADLKTMHIFAARWRHEHRGRWQLVSRLSGFCLLIKRAVFESLGRIEKWSGLGRVDDDDLSRRASAAGFQLAVALYVFVHNSGSRMFKCNRGVFDVRLKANRARLGATAASETIPESFVDLTRGWADTTPAISPNRCVRVSLTMIVRDEQKNLPACLASAAGLFDEIVIVTLDRPIAPLRLRALSERRFSILPGLTTSQPPAMPPWIMPQATMSSGSMPTIGLSRPTMTSSRPSSTASP